MRKVYLLIAIALGYLAASGQEQKISGIGIFKINSTTISIINDIGKEFGVDIEKTASASQIYDLDYKHSKYVLQVIPPISHATFCPGFSVYKISSYEISTFHFDEIYLTFLNDTLVSLKSNYVDDLANALETKYGKPENELNEKEITCTYTYTGAETKHKEQDLKQIWQNGNIHAEVYVWIYYTSDCKENTISGFYIEDSFKLKKIDEFNDFVKKRRDEEKNKELKSKSEGL